MANIKIDLTLNDMIKILGDGLKERYHLDARQDIVFNFSGETPLGVSATITEDPKMPPVKPFTEDE